jgi:hypothetical protein
MSSPTEQATHQKTTPLAPTRDLLEDRERRVAMPPDLQQARELFLHAVGQLPPEEWESYVAEACGGDAELEQQVERLLQVHHEAGSFLDRPAADVGVTGAFTPEAGEEAAAVPPPERPGTQIGPYKLSQQIGEGGMGTVFMAEQTHPVRRKVALKVIKAGQTDEVGPWRTGLDRDEVPGEGPQQPL